MPPPMVPMLPQSPPTLMLPMLPQSPPMLELTSLARDLLTPMLKLSHGWPILTTDMLDTHMPPPMVPMLPQSPPTLDTLLTVHTPTDVESMDTDTDGKNYLK